MCQVVKSENYIRDTELPNLDTVYASRLQTKTNSSIKDFVHTGNKMFDPILSGKKYRAIRSHTHTLQCIISFDNPTIHSPVLYSW